MVSSTLNQKFNDSKKKIRKKPEWNATIHDVEAFKLSAAEIRLRKDLFVSPNAESAKNSLKERKFLKKQVSSNPSTPSNIPISSSRSAPAGRRRISSANSISAQEKPLKTLSSPCIQVLRETPHRSYREKLEKNWENFLVKMEDEKLSTLTLEKNSPLSTPTKPKTTAASLIPKIVPSSLTKSNQSVEKCKAGQISLVVEEKEEKYSHLFSHLLEEKSQEEEEKSQEMKKIKEKSSENSQKMTVKKNILAAENCGFLDLNDLENVMKKLWEKISFCETLLKSDLATDGNDAGQEIEENGAPVMKNFSYYTGNLMKSSIRMVDLFEQLFEAHQKSEMKRTEMEKNFIEWKEKFSQMEESLQKFESFDFHDFEQKLSSLSNLSELKSLHQRLFSWEKMRQTMEISKNIDAFYQQTRAQPFCEETVDNKQQSLSFSSASSPAKKIANQSSCSFLGNDSWTSLSQSSQNEEDAIEEVGNDSFSFCFSDEKENQNETDGNDFYQLSKKWNLEKSAQLAKNTLEKIQNQRNLLAK